VKWSLLWEIGWFGWRPRRDHEGLLPAVSLWFLRVSWCRGHLRTALLTTAAWALTAPGPEVGPLIGLFLCALSASLTLAVLIWVVTLL
jgi:hypothetical protein